jgi:uncharacterized protein Yka (UPF0111/DUF47 family)
MNVRLSAVRTSLAEVTAQAVGLLGSLARESNRLNALTEEIIRIEEQADQLHDQGRKELFLTQHNAIAFVIGTEVYGHLAHTITGAIIGTPSCPDEAGLTAIVWSGLGVTAAAIG